jgi:cell division cycle 14
LPLRYEHYDEVAHGDLNWIIPNKLLAFGSPVSPQYVAGDAAIGKTKMQTHEPSFYIKIFKEMGVSAVVRTCKPEYCEDEFSQAGMEHHDLYFVDGSVPHIDLVTRFLDIVSHSVGAVAVHCKAGLGRTGTLMCAYLMRYFGFTAAEAIAHCRIRRPGSVIGEQQVFLSSIEAQLCGLYGTFDKKKRALPDSGRDDYSDSDASSSHDVVHAPKPKKKKLLPIIEDDVSNSSTATL